MNKIKIPLINKELAEEIGIHIGDGSLGIYPKQRHYDYTVCMGLEDEQYLLNYVFKLISHVYGLNNPCIKKGKDNSINLVYGCKELVFWKKKMGLPIGKKEKIRIPNFILNSIFISDCLRGIFDTDGSIVFKRKHKNVHYYPVIKLYCKSKILIQQIEKVLLSMGIKPNIQYNTKRTDKRGFSNVIQMLHINGSKNLEFFIKNIGFSNIKHMTKYLIWKNNGYLEPNTNLNKRLEILNASDKN